MIEPLQTGSPKIVAFRCSGKLHDADYKDFMPQIDASVEREGKIRLLAEFDDFHGWDLHAGWDDFRFGLKHYSDFERIAMIGDHKWQGFMASLCKPFTKAQVRFFDKDHLADAWQFVSEGLAPSTSA